MTVQILLDTHVLIWMGSDPARLSDKAAETLRDPSITLLISPASLWKLAIKLGRGRISLHGGIEAFANRLLSLRRTRWLGITPSHLAAVAQLPPHHGDPFDRLLIAQALVEAAPLVSKDAAFGAYTELQRIWQLTGRRRWPTAACTR